MSTPKIPYTPGQVLRKPADWKNLRFYHKSDTLFLLTCAFCDRFLPKYGDRTVDQMVQAARSGKQNIIEGSESGKTSTESELKLLNVARASIGELREDYRDHLNKRHLQVWEAGHPCFQTTQNFTRARNNPVEYMPYADRWSEEEFCNICITLCFQVDAMINSYLKDLEQTFVTEGGIKERMHKARTGYRDDLDEHLRQLEQENAQLRATVAELTKQTNDWQAAYNDLKQRAVNAYNDQQTQIAELKARLGE